MTGNKMWANLIRRVEFGGGFSGAFFLRYYFIVCSTNLGTMDFCEFLRKMYEGYEKTFFYVCINILFSVI